MIILNIFLVLLGLSLLGIAWMLGYRVWEFKAEKIALPTTKTPLISFSEIAQMLPSIERHHVEKAYGHVERYGKKTGQQLIKYKQKLPSPGYLKKAKNLVRGKAERGSEDAPASSFIKKIAEHKEKVKEKQNNKVL